MQIPSFIVLRFDNMCGLTSVLLHLFKHALWSSLWSVLLRRIYILLCGCWILCRYLINPFCSKILFTSAIFFLIYLSICDSRVLKSLVTIVLVFIRFSMSNTVCFLKLSMVILVSEIVFWIVYGYIGVHIIVTPSCWIVSLMEVLVLSLIWYLMD